MIPFDFSDDLHVKVTAALAGRRWELANFNAEPVSMRETRSDTDSIAIALVEVSDAIASIFSTLLAAIRIGFPCWAGDYFRGLRIGFRGFSSALTLDR